MNRNLLSRLGCALLVALALGGLGCKKETTIETVVQQCGPSAPNGACAAGQTCFGGACVDSATLCSATNLAGTCASGMTCFGGGCVLVSALCSTANPTGPCLTGSTCFQGACVATASLCSSSNKTGTCETGKTCEEGVCVEPGVDPCTVAAYTAQPTIGVDSKSKITVDGKEFKDLNGNGTLEPYEDWRLVESCRAKDLVGRMSAAQKVGLMSEGSTIGSGTADGTLSQATQDTITVNHVRQALIRLGGMSGPQLAAYLNNVQKLCEAQPLGIPFVVTTDPSHGFGLSTDASTGKQSLGASSVVSPWPLPLGLGAINDEEVTRLYGDTVRREFMAMGFRWQLGPMADLASEPRWARVQNTFGENAYQVAKHAKACIEGFQNKGGTGGLKDGIAATMKHFPGAGADEEGMDSHSRPGKYNVYPGGFFKYHQIPFLAAIDAGAAAVMPCYSIFKGQMDYDPEQTGAAFSKTLITDYLKTTLGFSGMVTSDWGTMSTSIWGVEGLTQPERAAMFVKAGSHQLGSDSYTLVQAAYDQGLLTDADLSGAAEKILEMSFKLGIFENPYVDEDSTEVRSEANLQAGFVAQKKAIVLLKNRAHEVAPPAIFYIPDTATKYLPIDGSRKTSDGTAYIDDTNGNGTVEVYYDGVNDGLASADVVSGTTGTNLYSEDDYDYTSAASGSALAVEAATSAETADLAVVRITARKGTYFGLDRGVPLSFDAPFPGEQSDTGTAAAIKDRNKVIDLLRIRDGYKLSDGTAVAATNPTLRIVLVMHLDRPGIVKPFVNGLASLDEPTGTTSGTDASYPTVSDPANLRADGLGGVDGFLVEFGAYDRAVLDVLFNKNVPTTPTGYAYGKARLPIEIPASDEAVDAQFEDVPADTGSPTYALGAGMTY